MDEKVLLKRTVVLTTYQTLESDYRQQVNRTKVQCQWCGRLFQKQKLFYHQKYFCGPDAQRTEKQAKAQRKADFKDRLQKSSHLPAKCSIRVVIIVAAAGGHARHDKANHAGVA